MSDTLPQNPFTTSVPANEPERLAALRRYKILDTPPEIAFDRITRLATRLFNLPIALISLVDESRAWFKSSIGFEASEVPRDMTLRSFVVLTDEPLIIPDTQLDDRFACNPLVQTDPGVRFYAGAPLISHDGFNLGTLCLLDSQPRDPFTPEQEATLVDLAAMVVNELELRLAAYQTTRSEEKYRSLFESIDEGFCLCEMLIDQHDKPYDYRFLEVNPIFAQLTGLEDAVGKTARQLVPNLEDSWIEIYGRVVLTGETVRFEQQSIAMDRWFDVNAFRVGEPQSHQFGILFTNITAAKHREAERKKAEQEREQFFAVSSNLQVITGNKGYFQWVSPAFERILGWTQEEMISHPWTEFVHPDDINASTAETASLFSGNETFRFENRYRHKDGSYRWFLWNAQPNLEKQVIYGAAIDITDRKQAEVALCQSEERFRAIVNQVTAGIAQTDLTGRFILVNQRYCDIVGYSRDELLQKRMQDITHPDDLPQNIALFQQLVTEKQEFVIEKRYLRKDGSEVWVSNSVCVVKDEYGNPQSVVAVAVDMSGRRQIEVALRDSEERFRTLTATIPQLIWTAAPNGNVDYLSDQWAEYIGLPPERLYDWSWQQIVHPEDLPNTLQQWERSIRSGEPIEVRHRFRYRTGEWRWNLVRGVPVRNETGQVDRWFGTCTDVHDSEMREQDARFLSNLSEAIRTIDQADDLIATTIKMIGKYLQIQRCYFAQTDEAIDLAWITSDYHDSLPSLVGEHPLSHYPPEVLSLLRSGHLYISNDNKLDPRTIDCYEAVYEPLAIRAHVAVPFQTDSRWTVNLIAATNEPRQWQAREISLLETAAERIWLAVEKLRSDTALRQSEERYRLLAETIPQFVWITNAAGQNEYVNQRFCDFTGLIPNEMLDLGWLSIVHPEDLERTQQCWLAAVSSGQLYEIEYRFRRADGVYRWFLGQGIPMKDEQGRIIRWFGTCTDIEPQKQIEQARLRLLKQEQAARESAEQANRIKDEFLAVLSHELRTPMNPIVGWAKLMRGGRLDAAKTAQALDVIDRNAQLQVQLIDDLLDISRILQGKLNLDSTQVDLKTVIAAALETVQLAAEAKAIRIQSRLSPLAQIVQGDAGRLQQVVWNLLSNAVKFTPAGGQVEIELFQVGANAQIQVRDSGKGIAPGFLPYVFEHFRQEDGATTRKFGGLGLGLAIARQIVELHGGTVTAQSEGENRGAIFTVLLPLIEQSDSIASSEPTQSCMDSEKPLSNLQILMVDDENDTREFQAFVLEQSGARVTTVASGLEALQVLDRCSPDILISDIGMPGMDGYELIRQIRSRTADRGGKISAIALTAYAGELNQRKAIESGFQAHLSKPVEPEILVKTIAQLSSTKVKKQDESRLSGG